MIREIIKPQESFIRISIPNEYINKNIEILIFDIDEQQQIKKIKPTNELLEEFRKISKNISKVDKHINILKLDEDMNSDIF